MVDCIRKWLDYAVERSVVMAIANHYKDNFWQHHEFAKRMDVFIEIVNQIDSPWFGVQYDPWNTILSGEDPLELLGRIKTRVVAMHASDRFLKPGHTFAELRDAEDSVGYAAILSHGVVGKGMNDYPRIFSMFREARFDGWIFIEDGLNGLEEIRTSAEFLRELMSR